MLESTISKYKKKDIEGVVYQLSYSGKFIVIKGKTLVGSLIIIANTFNQYNSNSKRFKLHLYRHLYDHFIDNPNGRFRIKVLAKINKKTSHYDLLKREQMELDKNRYNPLCLNNSIEAYIPNYNEETQTFGWLPRHSVMNFQRYLTSKERTRYISRYSKKPVQEPAKSDL